jgi:3',5'-cyclic-AMP phosphodiesterase
MRAKSVRTGRILGTSAIVLAIVFLTVPSNGTANDASSPQNAEVSIDNFSFQPQTVTVAVGTTVTWTNRDDIPHTVVSTEGLFKSKARDTDEKFSFTFTKAGTYSYYCSIHPKMTGAVVVH